MKTEEGTTNGFNLPSSRSRRKPTSPSAKDDISGWRRQGLTTRANAAIATGTEFRSLNTMRSSILLRATNHARQGPLSFLEAWQRVRQVDRGGGTTREVMNEAFHRPTSGTEDAGQRPPNATARTGSAKTALASHSPINAIAVPASTARSVTRRALSDGAGLRAAWRPPKRNRPATFQPWSTIRSVKLRPVVQPMRAKSSGTLPRTHRRGSRFQASPAEVDAKKFRLNE
jgi:hypothetical protein